MREEGDEDGDEKFVVTFPNLFKRMLLFSMYTWKVEIIVWLKSSILDFCGKPDFLHDLLFFPKHPKEPRKWICHGS